MLDLPENNPSGDTTPADITGDAPPDRREALFAPPRRAVVPLPVYKHRMLKALSSKVQSHFSAWSVERFLAALFLIFAFGVLGVFIADTLLCPRALVFASGTDAFTMSSASVLGVGWSAFSPLSISSDSLPFRIDSPTGPDLLRRQAMKSNVAHWES